MSLELLLLHGVKLRHASYATKPTLWEQPQETAELICEEGSTPAGDSMTSGSNDDESVYMGSMVPFEPDYTTPCNPAPIRLDGALAARRNSGHSSAQACVESQAQLPKASTTFASVHAPSTKWSALPKDPSIDTDASTETVTFSSLADALESMVKLVGITTSGTPMQIQIHLEPVVSALQCFGPQLLPRLDARTSAELLCLFGKMSDGEDIPKPRSSSQEWGQGRGKYWEEVIMIAEAKEALGHVFGKKENYWSMRAYLEQAKSYDIPAARQVAKAYYLRLAASTRSDPSIIVPYLNIFLVCPSKPGFGEALDTLCRILGQRNPHRRVVEIFWRVILVHNGTLSPDHKTTILYMIYRRLFSSQFFALRERSISSFAIRDLVTGFAASLFPCYQEHNLPDGLLPWVQKVVRSSVNEGIPIDDRFKNLALIAAWILSLESSDLPELWHLPNSHEWGAVIGLAILDRRIRSQPVGSSEKEGLKDIARSLWRLWADIPAFDKPREVGRVVAATFLHIATRLGDGLLLDPCLKYISTDKLMTVSSAEEPEPRQVEQLFGMLSQCILVSKGRVWTQTLSLLKDTSHSPIHLSLYLWRIFQELGAQNAELAYQFFRECLSREIPVSPAASILVVQNLALEQSWDKVATILQEVQISGTSLELILEIVLSSFRTSRQEATTPALAAAVGEALLSHFSNTSVPSRLKYPIRFFLPIMIASQHPRKTVEVLEVLLHRNPTIFSSRYFIRVIHTLFRRRQLALGFKVFCLAAEAFKSRPVIVSDLARKTKLALVRAGAFKLASHPRMTSPIHRTLRDRIVCLSLRRPAYTVGQSIYRLIPALTAPLTRGPVKLIAVHVLLQNRRFALARQLIGQSYSQLKPQDLTAIGNAYLHGHLLYWNKRNGRLLRHVVRSKNFLAQKYGFVPDRVTVNIVIKAMLRWRVYLDSRNIMSLFDHLVRKGYPASERWHTANDVPFGTLPGEMALDLSGIQQGLSFKRHVRPLYKMFIRELFLRKNPRAAHRIVGILKEEEARAVRAKEHRERARRLGIIKKQQRERTLAKKRSGSGGSASNDQ
ncbi:hypothetical protein D9756_003235 [Leucocoprinus leucothites]|uniref:Uncharacterized protein n=1 Tax=Leucocoprinus leucothites TaxID=201217 RepID=A0A8H5G6I1_9AGAR|nr:hypothetical protein D9756_003235 [Leucoagaricus leucothites]